MSNTLRGNPYIWLVIGALALGVWGCDATLGDEAASSDSASDSLAFLDTDQNGTTDAIDIDGDGQPDFSLPDGIDQIASYDPLACPITDALIDRDGDDRPDALDLDCDGTIDFELLPLPIDKPDGSGQFQVCEAAQDTNGTSKVVACVSLDGENHKCACTMDDVEVSTCETSISSPCSIPGNCCGF